MIDLNLTDAFEVGLRKQFRASRRGDEAQPHVSHLGKCMLQTYLSRYNAQRIELSTRSRQLMLKGLHDEQYIVDVLAAGLKKNNSDHGWQISRSGVLGEDSDLVGHLDVEIMRALCEHDLFAEYDDATGWTCRHATHAPRKCEEIHNVERALIEIKTTQWRERWEHLGEIGKRGNPIKTKMLPGPYPEVTDAHRLQALGYAIRRDIRWYSVFQWDRALHGFTQYPSPGEWFDARDPKWLARHDMDTMRVIRLTDPETNPLETYIATLDADGKLVGEPPEPWMCGFCDYAQCARNTNKNNAEHAIEEVTF